MQIKILKKFYYVNRELKVGEIVEIKDDSKGNPLNPFWRNRLKDSKIDNCVEIVKDIKQKKEDK